MDEQVVQKGKRKYTKSPAPPGLRTGLLVKKSTDVSITWVSRAVSIILHAVMSGNLAASDAERLTPILRIALDSAILVQTQKGRLPSGYDLRAKPDLRGTIQSPAGVISYLVISTILTAYKLVSTRLRR